MKAKVKATELKRAIAAVLALQKLTETKTKAKSTDPITAGGLKGRITIEEGKIYVESANMGAYACVSADATMLRKGSVGIDLNSLEKLRITGTAVIGFDEQLGKLKITGGRSDYDLAVDQEAEALVNALVPDRSGAKFVAKLPTAILSKAAAMVAIKPGLKAEKMRMQFSFTAGADGNQMEVTGVDFYSYGRFVRRADDIKVKEDAKFVLRAASLSTILKNISGEEIMIGVQQSIDGEDTASVRFKSDDADVMYPTLDMPFMDPSDVHRQVTSGTFDGGFTALRKNVREALNTVKTVATANVPLTLNLRITPNDVQLGAENNGNKAVARIAAKDIKLPTDRPHIILLNQAYFTEVVSLAPEVVPMRVESWNRAQAIVRAEKVDNGRIEYSMSLVDSTSLAEEAGG